MQRTVIALRGKKNSGKTTTIKKVFEQLKKTAEKVERDHKIQKEIRAIILVIDGVKVGFVSVGEPAWRLNEYLRDLFRYGCKVVICATRSFGDTVEVVEALRRYKHVWIEKERSPASTQERGNAQNADAIIKQVKHAIASA